MVHRAAHFINQRNLDPDSIDERIAPYVEAWKMFCMDNNFRCNLSEHLVYRRLTIGGADSIMPAESDVHLIGTLDAEGVMGRMGTVIVDIKTGEPTDSWAPQLAAYTRGLSRTAPHTHKRVNVQLRKTGTYKLHWHPIRNFDRDWEIFRVALIEGKRKELNGETR